jgi:hypothetical protein
MTVEKYRPSNNSEAECFFGEFCCHCQRDRAMREGEPLDECNDEELCEIIGKTFAFGEDDPRYPPEWRYGPDGRPFCTAFVEAGEPIPPYPDTVSGDLFAQEM